MRDLQMLTEDPHAMYQTQQNPRLVGLVKVTDELPLTSGTLWACLYPSTD